jgi:hypothetical protein
MKIRRQQPCKKLGQCDGRFARHEQHDQKVSMSLCRKGNLNQRKRVLLAFVIKALTVNLSESYTLTELA